MVSRTKKTCLVHAMLIMASLWSESTAQIVKKAATFQPPVFQTPAYPGMGPVASKGYYNPQMSGGLGFYNTHPLNAAYWTGHAAHYPYYQYPQYQQYPYQYYPQPYGYVHPATGYAQSYGQYPTFDPRYWSMYQGHHVPYYPYNGQQMYYGGQPMYYGQGYYGPGGPYMHQPYPYYRKPFGAGFLGGNGHKIVKGLIGAALVGVIAGKVARG